MSIDLEALRAEIDRIPNLPHIHPSAPFEAMNNAWANLGRRVPELIAEIERLNAEAGR
jgi:hypothetical protein